MIYFIIFLVLFVLLRIYFRLADHYNIIDKPNNRSSHTVITIRGGGIIFYVAALFYFIWSGFQYPYFFLGLTGMAIISFLDDVFTLSNKVRLIVHLLSALLLIYQLQLFEQAWYWIPVALFMVIGIINAYNFMDGINGITAMYSFAVLFLLWLSNLEHHFIDERLLYCLAIGDLVFSIFNFKNKAKCFAGDVGSVSMSFILVFVLLKLIWQTQNLIYILFLVVYGVDAVLTIGHRLMKGENIFEAHRSHLYQYLSNEAKGNRLLIAISYGVLQLLLGILIIEIATWSILSQFLFSCVILISLSLVYILVKKYILRKHTDHLRPVT